MKQIVKPPIEEQILIEEINGVRFYELPPQSEQESMAWLLVYGRARETYLGYEEALANFVRRVEEVNYQ